MPLPRLTFYCELDSVSLQRLMTEPVIADLCSLRAGLSMGILDFDPIRVEIIHLLHSAGIPVIAWLLLPKEQGYYFHLRNASRALSFYEEFRKWTEENGLQWAGVGLDIEPDIRDFSEVLTLRWRIFPRLLKRVLEHKSLSESRVMYRSLVEHFHADGYNVESYQFPIITDERKAGSTLLQRISGLVDVPVDCEVWMLYTSFTRPNGPGILTSYAPEAQAIGLGVTGGGVDSDIQLPPPLTWDEFCRDLRLAWNWCDDLYIFSLEGCVQQDFLKKLRTFVWDYPILLPEVSTTRVNNQRRTLRSALWLSAHFTAILVSLIGGLLLWKGLGRLLGRYFRTFRSQS